MAIREGIESQTSGRFEIDTEATSLLQRYYRGREGERIELKCLDGREDSRIAGPDFETKLGLSLQTTACFRASGLRIIPSLVSKSGTLEQIQKYRNTKI